MPRRRSGRARRVRFRPRIGTGLAIGLAIGFPIRSRVFPHPVSRWASTRPSPSITTAASAACSCSSPASTRLTEPSASTGFGFCTADSPPGPPRRRSAVHPSPPPETARWQRNRLQETDSMDAGAALPPSRSTRRSGVRHSWTLRPPWAKVRNLLKQAIPGAAANHSPAFQLHGQRGTSGSDAPARTAHRAQRVSVRCFGRSTFGSPPGMSNQPWSVTTRTVRQPLSRRPAMRSARRSSASGIRRASPSPSRCPVLSISPVSHHPRAAADRGASNAPPPRIW